MREMIDHEEKRKDGWCVCGRVNVRVRDCYCVCARARPFVRV